MDTTSFQFGIFDLEGTLLSNKVIYRKTMALLLRLPLGWYRGEHILPSGGLPVPHWASWLTSKRNGRRLGRALDRICMKAFSLEDRVRKRDLPLLFPDAEETLEQLRGRGIALFGSTGSDLSRLQVFLGPAFALFQGFAGASLPKREHVPAFARLVGLEAEEFSRRAFWVGDGPVDMQLANLYGIYPVGISRTLPAKTLLQAGARTVITDLRELLRGVS